MSLKKRLLLIIGAAFLAVSFIVLLLFSAPTHHGKTLSFSSSYGSEKVTLQGTYWEVSGSEYAVLICPGYSCDRQKWRPMANVFVANGLTTMTFDYAGQGASSDTIGFNNAKTDAIPVEIADAIEVLHTRSGVDYDHIILVGHSMGGRSILRLLYDYNDPNAETTIPGRAIGNVILLSPEVNYNYSAQASLFAGTSDDADEPWHSYNASYTTGTNIFLFGSTADDIVSDEDILAIYSHLGGVDVPTSGTWRADQVNAVGSTLSVRITRGVLHSYQMYSPQFAGFVNEALTTITGQSTSFPAASMWMVYIGWGTALVGLLLTLMGLNENLASQTGDTLPVLTDAKKFLRRKLLMWLPGIGFAFLICCICVCMPFGSPVMNIPYMCFIAGYGLTMLLAYRKGRFKGVDGKLPKLAMGSFQNKKAALVCCAITMVLCGFAWYVLRATMYRLIPWNARPFWLLLATVLMAIGYYVSGVEADMLQECKAGVGVKVLYNLIQYVPLFLLVFFYFIIKSYSGMIGQAQNMVLMYIFCVPLGKYIRSQTGSRWVGAVVTAFLFQTLMITSSALISMF